eukprot:2948253-Rhodomonas_salina.2
MALHTQHQHPLISGLARQAPGKIRVELVCQRSIGCSGTLTPPSSLALSILKIFFSSHSFACCGRGEDAEVRTTPHRRYRAVERVRERGRKARKGGRQNVNCSGSGSVDGEGEEGRNGGKKGRKEEGEEGRRGAGCHLAGQLSLLVLNHAVGAWAGVT